MDLTPGHHTPPDLRVCFVGDSFTQGVGDAALGGWVGRLAARERARGRRLTAYNLGVRRETSADVAGRWRAECAPRLTGGDGHGVVVSFGVNDTTIEGGLPRVAPADGAGWLASVLDGARAAGWPVLVVGPVPIPAGDEGRGDVAELDAAFAAVCAARAVPYIPVRAALAADPEWWRSIERYDDGAHCDEAGYALLTDLIDGPVWAGWFAGLAGTTG